MPILEPVLKEMENILSFQLKYTKNHLFWLQFIEKKIDLIPKFLYIWQDRIFAFFESHEYDFAKHEWHKYLSNRSYRPKYHFRILKYSDNLSKLIAAWYSNIKDLKVKTKFENNCFDIVLIPPKHLKQFVIGKKGCEIEMLIQFLDTSIKGNFNYHIVVV